MSGGPARGLAIYGGASFLVYLETDGFRTSSPVLSALPFFILSLLTISTTMNPRVRYLTAGSFATLATSVYFLTAEFGYISLSAFLLTCSHVLYILSLKRFVKEWSLPLILLCCVLFLLVASMFFSDLLLSIPTLILLLSACLASAFTLVAISGSFLHYGVVGDVDDSVQYMCVRLVGACIQLCSVVLILLRLFGSRSAAQPTIHRLLLHVSQALLYLANERAF